MLIGAALPDPIGADRGHESITLVNTTAASIDLTGWALADAAGGRQQLTGSIVGGVAQQVTVGQTIPLGNRGDAILPINAAGEPVDQISYTDDKGRPGRTICFGR